MLKSIAMKNSDGQYVGLLLRPEEGNFIDKEYLDSLISIIKNLIINQDDFSANIDKISIADNEIIFDNIIDKNILDKIKNLCKEKISERLIVQQEMGNGPAIRHRPLYFELGNKDNSLVVKYTTLGEFNSIDVAINQLNSYVN